jgi:hypothetical protein
MSALGRRFAWGMQVFVESKYVNVDGGRSLKDHEIAGMLIATLFAGQHTSSITSSWTGYFMLTNKVNTQQNLPPRFHTPAISACMLVSFRLYLVRICDWVENLMSAQHEWWP